MLLRTISVLLHLSVDLLPFLPLHPSTSLPAIYRLIALMIYIVTLHPQLKKITHRKHTAQGEFENTWMDEKA